MKNILIIMLTGSLGSSLTFFVSERLKQGTVRASASLSLLAGLFFHFFPAYPNPYLAANIPVVFTGASFIGMVSPVILSRYLLLSLAGSIFGLIYLQTGVFFQGYGGALGTSASIALMTTLGLSALVRRKSLSFLKNRIFRNQ